MFSIGEISTALQARHAASLLPRQSAGALPRAAGRLSTADRKGGGQRYRRKPRM